jgi:hypothetical protein
MFLAFSVCFASAYSVGDCNIIPARKKILVPFKPIVWMLKLQPSEGIDTIVVTGSMVFEIPVISSVLISAPT